YGEPGVFYRASERAFNWLLGTYEGGLKWVLRHQILMLLVAIATAIGTFFLYRAVPKGFFPQQDTGVIMGTTEASQDISFPAMRKLQDRVAQIVLDDPAVLTLGSFLGAGGGSSTINNGRMFITLKPLRERKIGAEEVINRLRRKLSQIEGIALFLQPVQDVRVGGRMSKAQFQYALQTSDLEELSRWSNLLVGKPRTYPELQDLTS